jgi:predicted signal transduction protein with EAL and GGDEF domain
VLLAITFYGLLCRFCDSQLKAACYEAVGWPDDIKVAVNLSPTQLNNRNLLNVVTAAPHASCN